MFRLKTLGTLVLETEGRTLPPAASQKRPLALLAIIASHGAAGIAREKAALLLWPESDTESARHSLAQLLYSTRRALGADPFASTAGILRIDSEVMTADLDNLDAAMKSNDFERMADIYTGKFLDGFNLPDSVEFERWLDLERARRHDQVLAQLEKHAAQLSASGRHGEAAEWWKKLAALEPLDSRIAAELIKALDAAGNRPGALQHASIHSSLVRDELEIDPDPAVTSLERYLRTPTSPLPAYVPPAASASAPAAQSQQAPAASTLMAEVKARRHLNRRSIGAIAALVAIAAFVSASITRNRSDRPSVSGTAVAVLPFTVHSDSSIDYLREGLVGLLSSDLDGAGDLRAVDPRALLRYSTTNADVDDRTRAASVSKHFGANLFVLGDVSEAGGKLRISAELFDRNASTALSTATVQGERTRLFALVDELASKLLAGRYKAPHERLISSAGITTQSFPAFKEYLAGEEYFRAGEYAHAVQSFEKATALDTTFALAYYRMSIAAEWEGRPDLQSKGAAKALSLSTRLSDHDRMLVEAFAARRNRNPDKAEALYRRIVDEFPDDTEAWYQFGEVLFHDNAMRGRSFIESREPWEHVLHYLPNDPDALLHLTRVLARTGPQRVFDSVAAASLPFLNPSQKLETETLRAFTTGSGAVQDSMIDRLRAADYETAWQGVWRVAVYAKNIAGAERIARILVQPARPAVSKAIGHTSLMLINLARGKIKNAIEEDANVSRSFPWSKDVGNIYFRLLGFTKPDPVALGRLRSAFDAWNPPPVDEAQLMSSPQRVLAPQFKLYSEGLLSVAMNEPGTAKVYARRIRETTAPVAAGAITEMLATTVEAAALRKEGKLREALAVIENRQGTIPIELAAALGIDAYDGWLHAELLNETGRDMEALRWYESRTDLFISELLYLAPASLREAAIYEKHGDRAKAAAAYRAFIDLWKDADAELQPYVRTARARIGSITSTSSGTL